MLVESYIKLGEYIKALKVLIHEALQNESFFYMFDTEDLIIKAKFSIKESSFIEVPIFYSLHSRLNNSSHDSALKYAFDNFLTKNNFVFPTELFGSESIFGQEKLHYFLRWVCTPEVMKLYLAFDSPRHTEECRVKICRYLMKYDDNDIMLSDEIKDINRTHIMRKAVRKVENSRIYVDMSNLNGRDSQKFKSLFEKYIDLANASKEEKTDDDSFLDIIDVIKTEIGNERIDYWRYLSRIHPQNVKQSLKNSTFMSLAKMIRAEFTYGDRGLNNHLSTRIRHGVLPTALRKPLLEEGLFILKKDKEDFSKTPKWLFRYREISDNEINTVNNVLAVFSKKYEDIIAELNDKRLQVSFLGEELVLTGRVSDNTIAMFDYSVSSLESFALQKELPISPGFNDFVKTATQWLWDRTDCNLREVQKYIRTDFKFRLTQLLDELKTYLAKETIPTGVVFDFSNAVDRAKASLSTQIDVVCSWFAHTDIDEGDEYDIDTCVDIAKYSTDVEVSLYKNVACTFSERNLLYMVDVFFILFENAVSKSGLEKNELSIEVFVHKTESDDLLIKIINKTSSDITLEERSSKLEFYKLAYGDESKINDVLQKEGGTGLFKIWKILEKDLETPHALDIYFDDEDFFNVDILCEVGKGVKFK
ncbi:MULTISPECIES: hypothetical protein [Halomonas]|uniref:hypothetical protein n=1 Tax=Halomonas TaxID=2745 RepID=UPI001866F18E|nr:hypothetical protein [Halomonas citrativorans]